MKYKVNFISEAANDLIEIYDYVYIYDCKDAAEDLLTNLYKKCLVLQDFPERGHIPLELKVLDVDDFLEIHFKSYRIIYQIIKNEIFVHCVLDGRRDMQKLLQERLLRV